MRGMILLLALTSISPISSFSQPAIESAIFLPGIVSTGYNERDMAISADGSEMFYTIQAARMAVSVIITRTLKNGKWSEPRVAPFSGQFSDLEAVYSIDGKKLYFVSDRPLKEGDAIKDYDIWFVEKTSQGGWSSPVNAGTTINSVADEYYPSITADGSIYFTAQLPDALGKEDIYKSQWSNGQFQKPVNIGTGVNSKRDEFNAFVDPQERYIIFGSEGGEGDLGRGDLYVSYRGPNGSWSKAQNLGATVNSSRLDYCPYVYKETLYYTSERARSVGNSNVKRSFADVRAMLDSWGNGWGDLYFIPLKSVVKLP
jgi:hypothetical protein